MTSVSLSTHFTAIDHSKQVRSEPLSMACCCGLTAAGSPMTSLGSRRRHRVLLEIGILFGAPPFAAATAPRSAPHRSRLLLALGQNAAPLLSRCSWRPLRQPPTAVSRAAATTVSWPRTTV